MRPPRLRCTLFPLIYPPHLLVLPATLGLHLFWQTYPYFRALYVISVRRTKSLLTASFRFHLTMDTLAVLLYTSSLPRRVRDFHPLERTHGAQTKNRDTLHDRISRFFFYISNSMMRFLLYLQLEILPCRSKSPLPQSLHLQIQYLSAKSLYTLFRQTRFRSQFPD